MSPTEEQVAAYRRDGFLVVEEFLAPDEVERLRERFAACFAHEWETGLRPDEVNYDPTSTPADLTRQLCNAWKADRTVAATVLSDRNGRFGAALAGVSGLRLAQDNLIWKPPAGKALLCHQDAAYLDHLDPPNMTTCWMALDDTSADELEFVPIEVPAGGAAFHDGWTFHGSPPNERADRERRAVVSHMIAADTRWNPAHPHAIYSKYRRPGELELDEAFFPVIWRADGHRTPWIDEEFAAPAVVA
jgi:ectoine hydroxylase-related dioxygenase (phytanoyl-CoA dioxygenase family)